MAGLRRGSASWRGEHWKSCDTSVLKAISFSPGVRVHADARIEEALAALYQAFRKHGYEVRPGVTGAYNCRPITGGTGLSSHAFGIAIDVNWDTNPYGPRLVTDMSKEMIRDVHAIKTRKGVQVWRWGGDWDNRPETPHSNYDAMHFEIVALPAELAEGIPMEVDVAKPRTWVIISNGSRGPAVLEAQKLLCMRPAHLTGFFGPITERHVRWWQASRGLKVDGTIGMETWTSLTTRQDPVGMGEVPPNKGNVL